MKRSFAFSVVAVFALAAPPLAQAEETAAEPTASRAGAATEVALVLVYSADSDLRIYGATLSAAKNRCIRDRRVSFFEKLPGDDRLIGKAVTDTAGEASVHEIPAPPFGNGEFYAKVKRREVGNLVCKRAKSAVGSAPRSSSSAAAGDRAPTTVKFRDASYNDTLDITTYRGRISSPLKECMKNRKVTVFREGGTDDVKIGSDRAEKDGGRFVWAVSEPGPPLAGYYYARAKGTDACEGDKSAVFGFV